MIARQASPYKSGSAENENDAVRSFGGGTTTGSEARRAAGSGFGMTAGSDAVRAR